MKQIVRTATMGVAALMLVTASLVWSPTRASASVACPTDIMGGLTPSDSNYNDSASVNIGTRFKVNGAPFVRGVKFYKGVDNTGTHVAHLRKVGGSTDLASATFSGETSSGWQTVNFSSDVPLDSPTASYVVWVSMPNGHYALTASNFQFGNIGNPSEDVAYVPQGQSGVYTYTVDDTAVPANTTYDNFFVTPIVGDGTAPDANSGVSASDATAGPSVSWSGVGYDTNANLSNANPLKTQIIRNDGSQSVVIGSQSGGLSSWADIFSGTQADVTALPGTSYTYSVKNIDSCGNNASASATQFTTASRSLSRVFGSNPSTLDTGQTTPVVVGMHWQTDTDGKVWGGRFYRDSSTMPTVANSNFFAPAFKVSLWNGTTGTQLASTYVPVNNEQTGWIDVRFATPVDVTANTDYVIGYFSPNGREVYTNDVFDSAVTNGNLSARADNGGTTNGVYAAGAGLTSGADTFPNTQSASSTWYGVDVDFYIP